MTPSQNTLALGLLLTLCSNAVLLMLLLLQLRSGGENGSGFSGGCGVVGSEGAGFAKDVTVNIVPGGDLSESLSIDTGQETGADSLGLTAQFEDRRNSHNGGDTSKSLSREHPEKGDSFAQGANTFSYSPQLENTDEESLPKWAYTGTSPRHLPDKIAHIFKEYADTGKFPREAYTSSSPLLARLVSGHVMKTTLRSLSKVSERITKLSQSVNQFDEPRYRFRPRTRPDADQTGFQTHNIESRVNTNGDSDLKITHKSTGMETVAANSHRNKYKLKQSSISKSQNSTIHSLKLRRRRDTKETKLDSADERSYEQILADAIPLEEVFPTLTESELQKFSPPVSEILVPALIHFEGMMVRQIEMLNDAMVSLDLRLETLENSKLDWEKGVTGKEPQSDVDNNMTDLNTNNDVIGDNLIPVEKLDGETGSGEVEIKIEPPVVTTTPVPMTTNNAQYLEMYHHLLSVEQKVLALENYNVMADSEFTRTRSEVIKMDDKVTEMNRRQRNLQVRTSMQMYRITELEMFMAKAELALHTTLDAFGRMSMKLDSFKDKLAQNNNNLHAVSVQFSRQNQISNELRAADAYKAHDINEMRKTMMGLEDRLNGLYRTIDQNSDTVRNDVRSMLDRMCSNNKLSC